MSARMGVLALVMGTFVLCASAAEPDTPTVEALRARVAELETALTKANANLQKAREGNVELILQVGRLKQLCRQAAVDPDAKPATATPRAPIDPAAMDPAVRDFLARYNQAAARQSGKPGNFGGQYETGKLGMFHNYVLVEHVVDATNMLVSTFSYVETYATSGTHESMMATRLPRGTPRKVQGPRVWITDLSTEGKVDAQHTRLPGVFRVKGTRQYPTVDGGTKTVFELEPFDVQAYLADLRKAQPADAPAGGEKQ